MATIQCEDTSISSDENAIDWKQISSDQLAREVQKAREQGQHLFVWDMGASA
eukprot:CAMPEP_0185583222 /NCGR_PEP_ID=MMETSP0434-20130131/21393_1 /TAXON_ID=626734 ORGANISM="Favella taraikaensis, Strain Fe Narragansett Bay" /NCGR_SAMPLE_ID=MMETSP0434 /ASSEMBLY_ACC=CAM_ASM_000379 /LENGTH=51 /DNA_ID=CAMNT_0028202241 /DNA_START=64 /DNA_END=219 /DNA_ORIENTATION=+